MLVMAHLDSHRSPRRLARLLPAAVAAGVLLSGCQIISPRQTDEMYDAGDGVSVDVGPLQVRNLVVVGSGKDGPGVVSAAVGNLGDKDATITFAAGEGGAPVQATVPAYGSANLSMDGSKVTIDQVPGQPGDVVVLQVGADGVTSPVNVPIVPATGYYEKLAASS